MDQRTRILLSLNLDLLQIEHAVKLDYFQQDAELMTETLRCSISMLCLCILLNSFDFAGVVEVGWTSPDPLASRSVSSSRRDVVGLMPTIACTPSPQHSYSPARTH